MITIYKYPIEIIREQGVSMPEDAVILSVGLDPAGRLCLWARVNTHKAPRQRIIEIYGTGTVVASVLEGRFIGTVLQQEFIWHVFEVGRDAL